MNNIKKRIMEVFERCGLIDDSSINYEKCIEIIEGNVKEMDSFSYMTTLLEIESEFDIEIPDEFLGNNLFNSLDSLCDLIEELSKTNK